MGPTSTSPLSTSKLYGVTTSGMVKFVAMLQGTPSWSMSITESPVMTVRAEKSTRLPIRLPRTRPSFPLRRSEMDLIGRPERSSARGCPVMELSMYV